MTEEVDEEIDPRLVQLKLLSKISEGLVGIKQEVEAVKKLEQDKVEEGIIEPVNRTVRTSNTIVHPILRSKPWFGVKITNDSDAYSVFVIINPEISGKQIEIQHGETWGVTFPTAVIKEILLHTDEGSAAVRIRGER